MKLLSDENKCSQPEIIIYCQELFNKFVADCIPLFGLQFVSSNIHHLIHVVLDVLRFGPLDSFAAYSFDNLLKILKNLVRKSAKPLQQLVKRTGEIEIVQMMAAREKNEKAPRNPLTNCHRKGPLLPYISGLQYHHLLFKETKIGVTMPNNYIFFSGYRVAIVENFLKTNNSEIVMLGRQFMKEGVSFNVPLPSRQINYVEVWNLRPALEAWSLYELIGKAVFSSPHA